MRSATDQKYYQHLSGLPVASDSVFQYIVATYEGKDIRISWQLRADSPQIQENKFEIFRNDNFGFSEDWIKVGEVINDWTFLDSTIKSQLKQFDNIAYRIRVYIPDEFNSQEVRIFPDLSVREKLIFRALLRRRLVTQKTLPRFQGFLFKRLWKGEKCDCVDSLTGEITNSDCSVCFGTGIKSGYWPIPRPCPLNISTPFSTAINFDFQNLFLGTVEPQQIQAVVPAIFPISSFDVWVPQKQFPRFYIIQVTIDSEFKGVPVSYKLLMRQASRSDTIYNLEIPES